MTTKIEKNVPMPPARRAPGARGTLIISMEVGDSFRVPTSEISGLRQLAAKYSKKLGRTYAVRTVKDGARLWRVT
jgi:hypothetical protein